MRAENISVQYGKKEILHKLSFEIKQGSYVGFLGLNGCGKSSLLKALYGVLKTKEGCIFLDEKPLEQFTKKERAKQMAVMAQQEDSFDFLVYDFVLLGRSPYKSFLEQDTKEDEKIVMEALQLVGMEDFVNRTVSTLSGGERQRVLLARGIAQKTPYFILDEPTNHLDLPNQLKLLQLMKQLDCTVIMAIHDLNLALKYCDYVYCLQNGQIVGEGVPSELLTKEWIGQFYGVEVELVEDQKGRRHIVY